jgi:AcrR family transcriptional regulator
MTNHGSQPLSSLRERKKLKTKVYIQECALRLFASQGYAATTVEQIAATAEVSPSTFFRYYPNKESVALYDSLDPLLISTFLSQPSELGVIAALRVAIGETFHRLSPGQRGRALERGALIRSVPALRGAMLAEVAESVNYAGGHDCDPYPPPQ